MNLQQLDLGKRQRSARQAPEQEASAPRARRRATAFDRRTVYAGPSNVPVRPSCRKPPSFASIVMSKGCVLCHATVFVFDVSGLSSWSRGRAVPA